MEYKINEDFLPIGSIVSLRFNENQFMILGHEIKNDADNKVYDYMGVYYPYGFSSINELIFFNKNIIKKVHFFGFNDEEGKKYLDSMISKSDIEVLEI